MRTGCVGRPSSRRRGSTAHAMLLHETGVSYVTPLPRRRGATDLLRATEARAQRAARPLARLPIGDRGVPRGAWTDRGGGLPRRDPSGTRSTQMVGLGAGQTRLDAPNTACSRLDVMPPEPLPGACSTWRVPTAEVPHSAGRRWSRVRLGHAALLLAREQRCIQAASSTDLALRPDGASSTTSAVRQSGVLSHSDTSFTRNVEEAETVSTSYGAGSPNTSGPVTPSGPHGRHVNSWGGGVGERPWSPRSSLRCLRASVADGAGG